MRDLIPSLSNLPVIYTITATLVSMLLVAGISLYFEAQSETRYRGTLFWSKLIISLPLLALGAVWTYIGTFTLGVLALFGGTVMLLLLALAPTVIYAITTWCVVRWIRNKRLADVSVILVIVTLVSVIYTFQRAWLCEPFAHDGVSIAQLCTAQLYETGAGGVLAHRGTARKWYRSAADKDIAAAQYWVGMDTRDASEAKQWLVRAADQGHAPAAYQLFLLPGPEEGKPLEWLQLAVDRDYPPALYRLGLLHSRGYRVAHDVERARELWHRAAKAGHVNAMRELALAYAGGVIFDVDLDASRLWEQEAIAASVHEKPKKLPANEQHFARAWQRQLAELRSTAQAINANDPVALRRLGHDILSSATDNPAQRERGIRILEHGAVEGDSDSQYVVANYYLGLAVPTEDDLKKGLTWLTKAAENDHRNALRRLIEAHKEGQFGLAADFYKAKLYSERLFAVLEKNDVPHNSSSWLGPAWDYQDTIRQIKRIESLPLPRDRLQAKADAGSPEAQYYLARDIAFYDRDYEKSQILLQASARGGYPQAQYELSTRIFQRKRTREEEKQAVDWLYAAAKGGHRGAMVWLGSQYMSGFARHNIERNYYEARIWFERAIEGKDDIVYRQQTSPKQSWQISVASVRSRLRAIPDYMARLDLEGLDDQHRTAAINEWYERERNSLNAALKLATGDELSELTAALATLESQFKILLKADPG